MNKFDVTSHEQARELLPWLVNDSLAANERTLVREHAKNCVICRKELAELEQLRDSIGEVSGSIAIPAPDMRSINARIDALIEKENRGQVLISTLREFFASPWRMAFAAQTALLVVLATVLLWPQPDNAVFTTLTSTQDLSAGQYIRVVFDPDIGATELASMLDDPALTIVDGPSDRGVATLRITSPANDTELDSLLSDLLASPGVLFAQPFETGE